MSTVGLLGGSFNPPHRGHLALARTVLELGLADTVRLIPAAVPPHKTLPGESPEIRLAMTRLLAEEDARIGVDDIEIRRAGPSFTIDTLRQLRERFPAAAFRLIIGSDMAKSFSTWREYREILALAPPLIAERPDCPFTEEDFLTEGRFPMPHADVNSTMVRRLVAEGAPDAALLPLLTRPVLDFIRRRGLYA